MQIKVANENSEVRALFIPISCFKNTTHAPPSLNQNKIDVILLRDVLTIKPTQEPGIDSRPL